MKEFKEFKIYFTAFEPCFFITSWISTHSKRSKWRIIFLNTWIVMLHLIFKSKNMQFTVNEKTPLEETNHKKYEICYLSMIHYFLLHSNRPYITINLVLKRKWLRRLANFRFRWTWPWQWNKHEYGKTAKKKCVKNNICYVLYFLSTILLLVDYKRNGCELSRENKL